jgi:hypothetical protein
LDGFARALSRGAGEVVFVAMGASHLRFGAAPEWADRTVGSDGIVGELDSGNLLAIGTALFTGAVLDALEVDVTSLIDLPGRSS